jgi:hypothetical protein
VLFGLWAIRCNPCRKQDIPNLKDLEYLKSHLQKPEQMTSENQYPN